MMQANGVIDDLSVLWARNLGRSRLTKHAEQKFPIRDVAVRQCSRRFVFALFELFVAIN
jgi:hypothetical protein